ncbi:hypothetical protein AB4142_35900, partial [Variovorax sp. 2RAF20]
IESSGAEDFEQRVLIKNSAGQFEVHAPLTTKLSERFTVDVVGIDDDSGKLYVLTDQFSDLVQARLYDPVKKEFDKEPLAAHP